MYNMGHYVDSVSGRGEEGRGGEGRGEEEGMGVLLPESYFCDVQCVVYV